MNTYSDILGLHDYFQPAYDLTDERPDHWKRFIPNDKFFAMLRGVLNSLEGQHPDEKKSLWLQGTYGTGKSHATAVVKHLLFDDLSEVTEYVTHNSNFEDTQLKNRLLKFREQGRVFPAVLKGVANITGNRTFALAIEKAVKQALRSNKAEVAVKSDFERLAHHIEANPGHINWDKVIQSYPQLNMYVRDQEHLVEKLKQEDAAILRQVEHLSAEIGVHFSHTVIADWLKEVSSELRQQGHADSLMIVWDEFTSVLELSNSGLLLSALQDIAELSKSQGVYLLVVSHRNPQQAKIAKEDMEKVLGRFKLLDYSMEPVTTYHIIGAAIHKKDLPRWEQLRDERLRGLEPVIRRIVGTDEGIKDYNLLRDLFPIHPYTAYLATFIARNIGATERSIFEFLYNAEKGFRQFIRDAPTNGKRVFLTADALWDFFVEEFERIDYQRFAPILDRYKLHSARMEQEHPAYHVIFKGVLLLNAQYKMVKVSEAKETLVAPGLANIKSMFYGTEYAQDVEPALEFLHEQQIIARNPDDLFLIVASSLPYRDVEKEKEALKGYYDSIDKILSRKHIEELRSALTASILRQTEVKLFDAALTEYLLKSKLKKAFAAPYALHIAAVIARNIQEREQIKATGKHILEDPEFENVILVVFEELLPEEVLNQFIDYRARAKVAEKLTIKDEQGSNEDFAQKVLGQWIQSLKSGYVEWFVADKDHAAADITDNLFGRKHGKVLLGDFSEITNNVLSAKIFRFGLENLNEVKKNQNVWKTQMAKASAESFLFADRREFIEQKTASGINRYVREILKTNAGDYIIEESLTLKNGVDPDHPLVKMSQEIEQAIKRKKNLSVFNLGDTLEFLTHPPFGMYSNMVYFGALGFLLRDYVGKLYEAGKGKPLEKEMMRDRIVDLFNYWQSGKGSEKLEVRMGTEEEKHLLRELTDIFALPGIESLNDVKWGIRAWIKTSQYPLWVFTCSEHANAHVNEAIDNIIRLIETRDADLTHTQIQSILQVVQTVKDDLRLLIFKPERSRDLFVKWLKRIENVEIHDDKLEEVIQFIRRNMPEEIGVDAWKADNVREKVKDWYIRDMEQAKPRPPEPPTPVPPKPYSSPPESPTTTVAEKDRTAIMAKIEAYPGDWKMLLTRIVQEHQEIIAILERYL